MEKILISKEQIDKITSDLAAKFSDLFKDDELPPVFICVLKGAAPFMMDVFKKITCPATMEFVQYSSYNGGMNSTKNLVLKKDITMDISNRNVILVDDILDTGETLKIFSKHVQSFSPKHIYTCVLLDKKGRREEGFFEADFVGCVIANEFVCGYGLDYNECYRNAEYVFVPDKKEIEKADSYGNL